jgi:deoxyribonuclease-4
MSIGAHVSNDDPLSVARELGADIVQFFLSDPNDWKKPQPHPQGRSLAEAGVGVYIHSPYRLNVASLNNRIRIPSRKTVTQHAEIAQEAGARGLVVHGGHVGKGEDPDQGVANWRKLFERQAEQGGFAVPLLIENTAGGDGAVARELNMLARLWDAVGEFGAGFCLDTCHAYAAGWDLADAVDRVLAVTGRIDLVHLNNSRDPWGSQRDRHANLVGDDGTIDPTLLGAVATAAGAPVIVETPSQGLAGDLEFLRGLG